MNGIGPSLPLTVDDVDGHFSLIKSIPDEVQQNLIHIIMTNPGERTMDGNFGVGMRKFLFEQMVPQTTARIESKIRSQVSRYMPFVNIDKVLFNLNEYENLLGIKIVYNVPNVANNAVIILDFTQHFV